MCVCIYAYVCVCIYACVLSQIFVFYVKQFLRYGKAVFVFWMPTILNIAKKMVEASKSEVAYINIFK